jgi:hypothetical protein
VIRVNEFNPFKRFNPFKPTTRLHKFNLKVNSVAGLQWSLSEGTAF